MKKNLALTFIFLSFFLFLGCTGNTTSTTLTTLQPTTLAPTTLPETTMPATTENITTITTLPVTTAEVTITFETLGGSEITDLVVNSGESVLSLPISERLGYTFLGWSLSEEISAPLVTLPFITTNDVTLYAKWEINTYTVNLIDYDGSLIDTVEFDYNEDLNALLIPIPTREGYTFAGWYSDIDLTELYLFLTMPAEDINIYAKWNINTYQLTVLDYDGRVLYQSDFAYQTDLGVVSFPLPTRIGYILVGWDISVPQMMPAYDLIITAVYQIWQYTISFETNGGNAIDPITQDYDTLVNPPTEPIKEGYTFLGWFSDIELSLPYEFSSIHAEDITLYAKWEIVTYNISYNLDSGTNGDNPPTYTVETPDFSIFEPTKEGYTFDGWFDNSELSGTAITEITLGSFGHITLYAKWTVNQYTITYNIYDLINTIPLEVGETIISVSNGTNHSSALTSMGRLFTWGNNVNGELGDGTNTKKTIPTDITSQFNLNAGETILSISLFSYQSSALTSAGRVFTWGYNGYGQLGDGTKISKSTPTDITSQFNLSAGETIVSISLGTNHSLAITSAGRVFTWGHNRYGQLGDGTKIDKINPTEITSQFNLNAGETIVSISLGDHALALTSAGRVLAWGNNWSGQLGDGTKIEKTTPTDITSQFNLNLGETIVSVSSGWYHSSAITSAGRVFTWGENHYGILGDGTTIDKTTPTDITLQFNLNLGETIVSMSLGIAHSSALSSSGRLFTWGINTAGHLGDGTTINKTTPIEITLQFNLNAGETIVLASLGYYHSSALTSSSRLFTWGSNSHGQLGDGSTTSKSIPDQIGLIQVCTSEVDTFNYGETLTTDIPTREGYTFDGWYSDNLLLTPYTFTTMPAENITLYGKWDINTYSITYQEEDGTIIYYLEFEYNADISTLSVPSPTKEGYTFIGWTSGLPYNMPAFDIVLTAFYTINQYQIEYNLEMMGYELVIGQYSCFAFHEDGTILAWGQNDYGQLGTGDLVNRLSPVDITSNFSFNEGEKVIRIVTGAYSTHVLTSEQRIFSFGRNDWGQLGVGDLVNKLVPTLTPLPFVLDEFETIVQFESNWSLAICLTSSGRIFTFGINVYGTLGIGDYEQYLYPVEITDNFILDVGDTIVKVEASDRAMAAYSANNRIFTWGINVTGELGNGTTIDSNLPIDVTSHFNLLPGEEIVDLKMSFSHGLILTSTGRLITWGRNEAGQLGVGDFNTRLSPIDITGYLGLAEGETIKDFYVGGHQSIVITSNDRILTWGRNVYGQLGDGTLISQPSPIEITTRVNLLETEEVYDVYMGANYVILKTDQNTFYAWGINPSGVFGNGTTTDALDPISLTYSFQITEVPNTYTETLDYESLIEFIPTRDGYTFIGWYLDPYLTTLFEGTTVPAEDLVLYAGWEEVIT